MEKLWIGYKQITIIIVIIFIFVLVLNSEFPHKLLFDVSIKFPRYNRTEQKEERQNAVFEWTPYMDIVKESLLMKDHPLNDMKKTIEPTLSRVVLIGNSTQFTIGEDIRLHVTLVDGYGRVRVKGGDQLRVRIFEEKLGAYASGYVVDHYNGSYTGVVRALWKGKPKIEINIGCPREVARAWYHTMITTSGTRLYLARYRQPFNKTHSSKQDWLCHPFLRRITDTSNYYCNRTKENGGMSLYCARPEYVSCQDFVGYTVKWSEKSNAFTKAESRLLERTGQVLKVIQIKVDGHSTEYKTGNGVQKCSKYDSSKLWTMPSPVGYFYKKFWRTINCKRLTNKEIEQCLKNKHFILLGDSTVRQWMEYLQETYSCRPQTRLKSYKKCHSVKFNFSVDFSFSAIPGHYMVEELTIHSIPNMIDTFSNKSDSVIAFHQQTHPSSNHPDVFRDRMKRIRKSIQTVLQKNKHARFYFKGPHTFQSYPEFGDYFGFVYRTIALEVFDGLLDNIVYLDSKDMTISTKQKDFHPDKLVVKAMVEQFLSYVC